MKIIYILLFILICYLLLDIFNNCKDPMVNIKKENNPTWNRRHTCNYKLNKSTRNFIQEHKMLQDSEKWDIYIPCSYNKIDYEIENMPIKKNSKYFIIDNANEISSKHKLWNNIVKYYELNKAKKLIPDTFILNNKDDIERLKKTHHNKKVYILKKNIQRQNGLKIEKNINNIIKNKDNFIIAQELLQNPYTINKRKINMRFYILVVCKNNNKYIYVYNNGFMYYSKKKYDKNDLSIDVNITTGYIDRSVYKTNPLTLIDFKKYLEKYNISDYVFTKIYILLSEIFEALTNSICRNTSKLYNNISYQLFGSDIYLDNNLNPYIMEINKGPDLDPKDETDGKIKFKIMNDIHDIIGIIKNNKNNGFIKILEINNNKILKYF